jgi:hypothetical protein
MVRFWETTYITFERKPMSDAIPEPMKVDNKKFWVISAIAVGAFLLGALLMNAFSPAGAEGKESLATNEQVRSVYTVDIVDNPNFADKEMLKMNSQHLAEVCVRPTVKDVQEKKPLNCKVA